MNASNKIAIYKHEDFAKKAISILNKSMLQLNGTVALRLISLWCGAYAMYALCYSIYGAAFKLKKHNQF